MADVSTRPTSTASDPDVDASNSAALNAATATKRDTAKGVKLLLVSVLLLGLNWPVMKMGVEYFSPLWMVGLRFLLSVPVIALVIYAAHRRRPRLTRADVPVILGVGVLQFIVSMGLVTAALQYVPAGTASILIYTTPLWLLVMDVVVFRQRPPVFRVLLTLLSAAGCATIMLASGEPGQWAPLFVVLAAALFWAMAIRLVSQHAWQGKVLDAVFWQFLVAGIGMTALALVFEGLPTASMTAPRAIALLTFMGPVVTGIGFGMLIGAGKLLEPAKVALISTLTPLIGYLGSMILLDEPILPMVVGGGALMLTALALGSLPKRQLKRLRKRLRK
ncbi:DMT family transporter [Halomonas sp. V046]|uniref:DMT family transporter n=1 Tax=Halomonas sp. V046 TaxID=3459611 RepID=UPI004044DB08